jgi:hypothetical protein
LEVVSNRVVLVFGFWFLVLRFWFCVFGFAFLVLRFLFSVWGFQVFASTNNDKPHNWKPRTKNEKPKTKNQKRPQQDQ